MVLVVLALLAYALGWFDKVANVAENAADAVVDTAGDAVDAVADVAEDTVDTVEDVANMGDDVKDAIEEVEEAEEELMEAKEELDQAKEELAEEVEESTLSVDLEKSSVLREGRASGKSHNGTISFSEATLVVDGDDLIWGSFIVDMTSINSTDLSGASKDKLDAHLQAEDFFDVANFKTAMLKITSVDDDIVEADLTIKWKTLPISFEIEDDNDSYTAAFSIDSTKRWVQEWGSVIDQAKNALVSDDIDFTITLVAE